MSPLSRGSGVDVSGRRSFLQCGGNDDSNLHFSFIIPYIENI